MTRSTPLKFLAFALGLSLAVPALATDSILESLDKAANRSLNQAQMRAQMHAAPEPQPEFQEADLPPVPHRNQSYRFVDSLKRAHTVDLPAKLGPQSIRDLRLYVDSNMVLDTMSYAEYAYLDPERRIGMKYGRALYFGLRNAERHYDASLGSLQERFLHDTLSQIRLIKAEKARKQRVWTAVGIGGAGIAISYFMMLQGMETRCVDGPRGMECEEEGLSKKNGMLAGGALVTGLAAGGLLLMTEFDEEKLARRIIKRR